jgi:hypothetical protein
MEIERRKKNETLALEAIKFLMHFRVPSSYYLEWMTAFVGVAVDTVN